MSTNFMELFQAGGLAMYPLLLFSVIIWIIGIQKVIELSIFVKNYLNFYKELDSVLMSKNSEEVKWALKNSSKYLNNSYMRLFDEIVTSKKLSMSDAKESLTRRLSETQGSLKKRLWIVGTIGSTTPFVGLCGTVIGIMTSFKSIGESGKSGFGVVSAGISEALVATAAGILIAVAALIVYNYLQNKVNVVFVDFKNKVEDMVLKMKMCRQDSQESDEMPPRFIPAE
ncbi:MAG: MotA/TolQ/ExbB proton channel family protein [Oligoflexia bacterium]|nr:MotA/TolQ/ExbB proton channel family protein [Oligoflexia bacterium]